MRRNPNFKCPNCGAKLHISKPKKRFSKDTYTCGSCHKTFVVKHNWLLLFIELYIVMKLLVFVSRAIAGKMVFTRYGEWIVFLIEIVLAFLLSFFGPAWVQKLKIIKFVEKSDICTEEDQ